MAAPSQHSSDLSENRMETTGHPPHLPQLQCSSLQQLLPHRIYWGLQWPHTCQHCRIVTTVPLGLPTKSPTHTCLYTDATEPLVRGDMPTVLHPQMLPIWAEKSQGSCCDCISLPASVTLRGGRVDQRLCLHFLIHLRRARHCLVRHLNVLPYTNSYI
jgi:hypothetical protein